MSSRLRALVAPALRSFSSSARLAMPLPPAKHIKATPARAPRRPRIADPALTDPQALRFSLEDHPDVLFVVREPSSIPTIDDGLLGLQDRIKHLASAPHASNHSAQKVPQTNSLFHPVLSSSSVFTPEPHSSTQPLHLPPPLRTPPVHPNSLTPQTLQEIQSLRTKLSVTQLSRRFGVSRLIINMLAVKDRAMRNQIGLRNEMRQLRREKRWSVAKVVRREEKRTRRSMW